MNYYKRVIELITESISLNEKKGLALAARLKAKAAGTHGIPRTKKKKEPEG